MCGIRNKYIQNTNVTHIVGSSFNWIR